MGQDPRVQEFKEDRNQRGERKEEVGSVEFCGEGGDVHERWPAP